MREVELYRMTPDGEWEYRGLGAWEDGRIRGIVSLWPRPIQRAAGHYFDRRPSATHWEGSFGRERFRVVFRPTQKETTHA